MTKLSYPIWLPDLKSQLGISQTVINVVGSFTYVGSTTSIIVGKKFFTLLKLL